MYKNTAYRDRHNVSFDVSCRRGNAHIVSQNSWNIAGFSMGKCARTPEGKPAVRAAAVLHMKRIASGSLCLSLILFRPDGIRKPRGVMPMMRERTLKTFIKNNQQVILDKVEELENFGPTDICVLKNQIEHGIKIRERMKVITLNELTQLYIGLIAIQVVERDRGYR